MAAVTGDLYDVRMRRPRLTLSDLIVLVGALVAFLAGWAIKDWHDNRTRTVQVGNIGVAYPKDWLRFPSLPPEVFRAVSNYDGDTVLFLSSVKTSQTDVLQAVATNNANPARSEPGYTQLGNKTATVGGNDAVSTDYAYVRAAIGGSAVPAVIRGRQYAWIKNGQLYTFALEGPSGDWDTLRSQAGSLVDKIRIGA